MEEKSNNHTLVIALGLIVMFMIALPVVFFLVKDKRHDHHEFRPVAQAPVQPQQPQPAPQPVAPPAAQPVAPPVVVVPVPTPVVPRDVSRDLYVKGWEDAHYNRRPDPLLRDNPAYARGYRDYYHSHRPGVHIDFGIGFKW